MEDAQIVKLYWERNPEAIARSREKYGIYCFSLDRPHCKQPGGRGGVRQRHLPAHLERHSPARPSAFRAWLGRIVRNLSLDRWKQNRTAKRGGDGMEVLLGELGDCVPTPRGTEKALEDQEIAALISDFSGGSPRSTGPSSCGGTGTGRAWRRSRRRWAAARGR